MRATRSLTAALGALLALPAATAIAGPVGPTRTVQLAVSLPAADHAHLAAARAHAVAAALEGARALGLAAHVDGSLIDASGPASLVHRLFGPTEDHVPPELTETVSAVSDPSRHDRPLLAHARSAAGDPPGMTTPAELDTAYGLPAPTQTAPTPSDLAVAPIVATVQFAGWHAQDLDDYASFEHIYTDGSYSPVLSGQLSQVNLGAPPYDPGTLKKVQAGAEVALDQ